MPKVALQLHRRHCDFLLLESVDKIFEESSADDLVRSWR